MRSALQAVGSWWCTPALTTATVVASLTLMARLAGVAARSVRASFRGTHRALDEETRATALTENMLDALLIVDARARISAANPAACRLFGYAASEIVGAHLGVLVPRHLADDAHAYLLSGGRQALGQLTEWEGRRRTGETFPFELSMFRFETAHGPRFAGLLRDISERRQLEAAKRAVLATVTHELRTPLTSIRGSLDLIASGAVGALGVETRDVLAIARRNVERLVRLTNDLLDLERLKVAGPELDRGAAAPAVVVQQSLDVVSAFAALRGISLRAAAAPDVVIDADEERVVQALVNLLSNAIKFSPAGGAVDVAARVAGGAVEFSVTDRGRGVPPEMREAVFERFRQLEPGDRREKGGSGLGLAIAKAIVERHGGDIGVATVEGGGSRFWFRLPVARAWTGRGVAA